MPNSVRKRAVAFATIAALGLWSVASVAVAGPRGDHGSHGSHGQHGQHGEHGEHGKHGEHGGQAQGHDQQKGQDKHKHQAKDEHHGHAGDHGDPAGNNGTVQVLPGTGCKVQVRWYGFDQGPGVVSTVSFAPQAPTADVGLAVAGPTSVPVRGNASESYTLSFAGQPHPKQGYHVRLGVRTPHSHGNGTKTKVLWVGPCPTGTNGSGGPAAGRSESDGGRSMSSRTTSSPGTRSRGAEGRGVLAESATAPRAASADGSASVRASAGAGDAESILPVWARSRGPLTLIAFVLVLVAVGIVLRGQSRA